MTRRVVTGIDAEGKSVFVSDGPVEERGLASMPEAAIGDAWGDDALPSMPSDGRKPAYRRFFPPTGGYRVMALRIPPDSRSGVADGDLDAAALEAEMEEQFPGFREDARMELDAPGMHTTNTVDVGVCIEGEITLELDDGASRTLRPGDIYVQNGTRHAWHNTTETTGKMVVFLVGAE